MCFYQSERVLSAIAKFLVYLLGKGRGGVKWKRGDVGEESGEGKSRRGK